MRSILVHADRTTAMEPRLETALALARSTDGHVSVLVETPVARFTSVDPMGMSYVAADAIRESLDRDDAWAREIEARLAREDVPFDVIRGEEEPVDGLADAARLADVVILSRGCDFAGTLALATRCPLLLVAGVPVPMPVSRACIAWDGGDEAAAALRASVPLLRGADVHVLTIEEERGAFPSTAALRYLSRHGVNAEFVAVERTGSTTESLTAAAARLQAELLVLGAYGRSRMREFLFGGVTRNLLADSGMPALLVAH